MSKRITKDDFLKGGSVMDIVEIQQESAEELKQVYGWGSAQVEQSGEVANLLLENNDFDKSIELASTEMEKCFQITCLNLALLSIKLFQKDEIEKAEIAYKLGLDALEKAVTHKKLHADSIVYKAPIAAAGLLIKKDSEAKNTLIECSEYVTENNSLDQYRIILAKAMVYAELIDEAVNMMTHNITDAHPNALFLDSKTGRTGRNVDFVEFLLEEGYFDAAKQFVDIGLKHHGSDGVSQKFVTRSSQILIGKKEHDLAKQWTSMYGGNAEKLIFQIVENLIETTQTEQAKNLIVSELENASAHNVIKYLYQLSRVDIDSCRNHFKIHSSNCYQQISSLNDLEVHQLLGKVQSVAGFEEDILQKTEHIENAKYKLHFLINVLSVPQDDSDLECKVFQKAIDLRDELTSDKDKVEALLAFCSVAERIKDTNHSTESLTETAWDIWRANEGDDPSIFRLIEEYCLQNGQIEKTYKESKKAELLSIPHFAVKAAKFGYWNLAAKLLRKVKSKDFNDRPFWTITILRDHFNGESKS